MKELLPYTLRESARARRVSLRVSPERGLEVVVPPGFDPRLVPDIVQAKRAWVERQMRRLEEHRALLAAHPQLHELLPAEIALQAVDQTWRVSYRSERGAEKVCLSEGAGHEVLLSGRVRDGSQCAEALRGWLRRQARGHLVPWAERLADELDVSVTRITIRGQKTRWGSYSVRGTLSLNYKLLFLPRRLVRFVLVHELCHARVMNHSKEFWAHVRRTVPEYRQHRGAMRDAWKAVPRWAHAE